MNNLPKLVTCLLWNSILIVATLTQLTANGQQGHIGSPYIAIGHPVGNGRIEMTIYRDNRALKKRNVKLTSESELQGIAAGIVTHEILPRVGLDITVKAFVTRAGWVNGDYVMRVDYAGYQGGAHY